MAVTSTSFALNGGLNLADEQISLKPGEMTDCLNVDVPISGGCTRTGGYEIFDGRSPKPSDTTYRLLGFGGGGIREVQSGDVIEGDLSGATATICGAGYVATGSWAASTAAGSVGIALKSGTFQVGEAATINGVFAFTITALDVEATLDDPNRKDYRRGAANAAREAIGAPEGSGAIRGGFVLKGNVYAVRDNADATAGVIHKATPTGWQAQTFVPILGFDAGTVFIPEGAAINGQTSGATATVRRTALRGGDWNNNTARGVLALTDIVGTFQDNENIRIATTVHAVVNGTISTPSLPAGGRYEFVEWNFYASSDTQRIYGCNGVGPAFEFDDNAFVPILTGMTVEAPEHIEVHKNYLYLSFKGSLQNSGAGEPHAWTVRLGASELGIGDQITALQSVRNDVLAIAAKNSLHLLYGSAQPDWSLKKMSDNLGAYQGCVSDVPGSTVHVDTNGLQSINASQAYGDFEGASLSRKVNPLLRELNAPVALITNRLKSQLRIYYASGAGLCATFAGERIIGWAKWSYPIGISCVWTGEDAQGEEVTFIGGTDGAVYQADRGNSFNGQPIQSMIRLPFHAYGAPERKKRWRKISAEFRCRDLLPLQFATEYEYSDGQYLSFAPPLNATNGAYYDAGFQYGEFVYDGAVVARATGHIDGISTNMSAMFYVEDDVSAQWTIQAVHIQVSPYGLNR
jgi:hypothetical protein